MIQINSGNVIIDNVWLWRADHSIKGVVKNMENPVQTALQINGDNVTGYGLVVSTLWEISQNGMEKMEGLISINLNSLMMLINHMEIKDLHLTKQERKLKITRRGEWACTSASLILMCKFKVLFRHQKLKMSNFTIHYQFSFMVTEKSITLLIRMEMKLARTIRSHMTVNGAEIFLISRVNLRNTY